MDLPTHEANFLSTAIGELLNPSKHTSLPDSTGQANAVIDPNTGFALNYTQLRQGPDGEQWIRAAANEIARLAQGRKDGPAGTNTMFFIPHTSIPSCRTRQTVETENDRNGRDDICAMTA
jgi:hypothetical protein